MKTKKYNNGIELLFNKPNGGTLKQHDDHLINLLEPIQELIFNEIILNNKIDYFVNLGTHVGYYVILAKKLSAKTHTIGFEGLKKFRKTIEENLKLNYLNVDDVEMHYKFLSTDKFFKENNNEVINFSSFLKDFNKIDFLLSDIQGAEKNVLLDLEHNNELTKINKFLIGTHDIFKGTNLNTHDECLKILKRNNYNIIYECPPRQVWLQPDGIIWAEC